MRARRLAGRAARRPLLLTTALYALAAFLATLPAVLDFGSAFISTGLPGYGEAASGDHLQTTYRFWLVGDGLERGEAPWRDPYSYQPLIEPQDVLGGWPYGLPFWPLEALFGPVVAWNLLLLATIVAAGVFTYLWLGELGLPPAAAAVGGLAFAIAPYRVVQSGGHLLGWAAVLLPLALFAFERSRRAASPGRAHGWGALAAATVVSIPLSGQLHLALGAVSFLALYAVVRYRRSASLWAWAGCLLAIGTGLAAQALLISGTSESGGRTLAQVEPYSATLLDLVSRWRLHGLERHVYLGWLTLALAIAGLVVFARRRRGLAVVLGLAVVVPALLALGTHLPVYETLRDVFPPLRYPRVPGRFLPVANLALAALAAVACAWLLARVRGTARAAAAALLLVLVAADLLVFPLRSSAADPGNDAYAALDREGPGLILELPVFARGTGQYGSVYLYYTLQSRRERPTGYSLAPSSTFRFTDRFNRLDCGAWLPGDREELERLGIRYLLVHGGLYEQSGTPGAWHAWNGLLESGYRPLAAGVVTLFGRGGAPGAAAPVPEPDRAEPLLCDGWRGDRLARGEGALWIYGSGRGRLRFEPATPGPVTVLVDGAAVERRRLAAPATVEVPLAGESWHALVVRGVPGLRLAGVELP